MAKPMPYAKSRGVKLNRPASELTNNRKGESLMLDFHKYTNDDGDVLILKRIPKDRKTYGGFVWPSGIGSLVECPDWKPNTECGGGLHGWAWGWGLGDGCDYDIIGDIWLVLAAKPDDVIGNVGNVGDGPKCKAKRVTIKLEGSFGDAMNVVRPGFVACTNESAKESGDNSKQASSGNNSKQASSGYNSKQASSGDNSKQASSGNNSQLQATGKDSCSAIAAACGRVLVGERGAFALADWTDKHGWRFITGKVGEKGIKANTWYEIRNGRSVKCKD